MRLTDNIVKRLHRECVTIAAARTAASGGAYPLDAEDIAGNAFLKAREKVGEVEYDSDWETKLKVVADCSVKNELKGLDRANNAINHRAGRIDDPDFGDIRDPHQSVDIDPPPPDWLVMTRAQIAKEQKMSRKIIIRLMNSTDSLISAMHHVGVSAFKIGSLAKKLQSDFNQCLQAYHECLRRNSESDKEYCVVYTNRGTNDDNCGEDSFLAG